MKSNASFLLPGLILGLGLTGMLASCQAMAEDVNTPIQRVSNRIHDVHLTSTNSGPATSTVSINRFSLAGDEDNQVTIASIGASVTVSNFIAHYTTHLDENGEEPPKTRYATIESPDHFSNEVTDVVLTGINSGDVRAEGQYAATTVSGARNIQRSFENRTVSHAQGNSVRVQAAGVSISTTNTNR